MSGNTTFGDILGRLIAQFKNLCSRKVLIAGNCLRLIFFLTTFYIVLVPNDFTNNAAVILLNFFLLFLTNGYFTLSTCN
jgi:hypothetical protein